MLNTIYIMGRLTADPTKRTTSAGTEYATFSVAVQRPKNGDKDPEADFFDCVAWDKLGNVICDWYHKGEMIMLVGTLRNRRYTDKNGNNRIANQIVVREVHFTGGKKQEQRSEDVPPENSDLDLNIPNEEEFETFYADTDGVPF